MCKTHMLCVYKTWQKYGIHELCRELYLVLDGGRIRGQIRASYSRVTTDGESANTGRNSGLWARMEEYAGHPTFNFWCACHRSDLARVPVALKLG